MKLKPPLAWLFGIMLLAQGRLAFAKDEAPRLRFSVDGISLGDSLQEARIHEPTLSVSPVSIGLCRKTYTVRKHERCVHYQNDSLSTDVEISGEHNCVTQISGLTLAVNAEGILGVSVGECICSLLNLYQSLVPHGIKTEKKANYIVFTTGDQSVFIYHAEKRIRSIRLSENPQTPHRI